MIYAIVAVLALIALGLLVLAGWLIVVRARRPDPPGIRLAYAAGGIAVAVVGVLIATEAWGLWEHPVI